MKYIILILIGLTLYSIPLHASFRPVFQDALKSKKAKVKTQIKKNGKKQNDEMVLDEITIKGRVDKPGVIIVPKRVEPEMTKIELERSFSKEIKEGVGEISKPEKELKELDRVKSIKKTLKRKRK